MMLIFGGTDPTDFSSLVLEELLQMDRVFDITLVLGAGYTHRKNLSRVLKRHSESKSKVQVVQKIKNVAERMFHSDVVLASPGLTFFESLMVGTPVLAFHHNEFQRASYEGFATTLGKDQVKLLPWFIERRKFTYPDSSKIASLKIGKGKDTIVEEILK